eukprot:TRINITY_DN2373_c0_g2_i1.p1 TRINITY_DN2373_c0_g2~~TRINITY_DN2373_c0_g2_i1.p1  ORF type:complete len:525 (+),score=26.40 TRINITY_DN2373_c0_g2_i1:149-1723(+)
MTSTCSIRRLTFFLVCAIYTTCLMYGALILGMQATPCDIPSSTPNLLKSFSRGKLTPTRVAVMYAYARGHKNPMLASSNLRHFADTILWPAAKAASAASSVSRAPTSISSTDRLEPGSIVPQAAFGLTTVSLTEAEASCNAEADAAGHSAAAVCRTSADSDTYPNPPMIATDYFVALSSVDCDVALPLGAPNIFVIARDNVCWDFGAWSQMARMLLTVGSLPKDDTTPGLKKPVVMGSLAAGFAATLRAVRRLPYKFFIFLNASVRGPFLPPWAPRGFHWTEAFTRLLDEPGLVRSAPSQDTFHAGWRRQRKRKVPVKLVGTTINCSFKRQGVAHPHVQSMAWAVDAAGLAAVMGADPEVSTTLQCTSEVAPGAAGRRAYIWQNEVGLSRAILQAGFDIKSLMTMTVHHDDVTAEAYHPWSEGETCNPQADGSIGDPYYEGHANGTTLHPYEVVLFKSNRGISAAASGLPQVTATHNPRPRAFLPRMDAYAALTIDTLMWNPLSQRFVQTLPPGTSPELVVSAA